MLCKYAVTEQSCYQPNAAVLGRAQWQPTDRRSHGSECCANLLLQSNRVIGVMQLFSVENNGSQLIEGHVAVFAQLKIPGNSQLSTLFCFAAGCAQRGKVYFLSLIV